MKPIRDIILAHSPTPIDRNRVSRALRQLSQPLEMRALVIGRWAAVFRCPGVVIVGQEGILLPDRLICRFDWIIARDINGCPLVAGAQAVVSDLDHHKWLHLTVGLY